MQDALPLARRPLASLWNVVVSSAVSAVVACSAGTAHAAPNDISIRGLVDKGSDGVALPREGAFRKLTTELALALTPSGLQPAETTGQSGFDIAIDYGVHSIAGGESYWTDVVNRGAGAPPVLQTLGLRARKGFVLPLPLTSEVELGGRWLLDSHAFAVGANARVALNEGFTYIPDVAVMAGVNTVLGADDLDLTTVTIGGSVSKGFGVLGSFNLCPFVAYERVLIAAGSRNLDIDVENASDVGANRPFRSIGLLDGAQDRVSAGLRVSYTILALSAGVDVDVVRDADGARCVLMQYALSAGLLF